MLYLGVCSKEAGGGEEAEGDGDQGGGQGTPRHRRYQEERQEIGVIATTVAFWCVALHAYR